DSSSSTIEIIGPSATRTFHFYSPPFGKCFIFKGQLSIVRQESLLYFSIGFVHQSWARAIGIYTCCSPNKAPTLKRVLDWEAIREVMIKHWRRAGKNVDGGPGLPWPVDLYVPLVVLLLVKGYHSRQMGEYLRENVVARLVREGSNRWAKWRRRS